MSIEEGSPIRDAAPVQAVEFRRATVDDAAAIAAVHVQSHIETYGALREGWSFATAFERRLGLWTQALAEDGVAFVALDFGRVIGFGHAVGDRLTTLYLLATYQRRGVGLRLLRLLLSELSVRGYALVRFNVLASNVNAIGFYESQGAEVVERIVVEKPTGTREELVYEIATGAAN
jgi:ribosomal protein S18 acetylase RimI-like enzyme